MDLIPDNINLPQLPEEAKGELPAGDTKLKEVRGTLAWYNIVIMMTIIVVLTSVIYGLFKTQNENCREDNKLLKLENAELKKENKETLQQVIDYLQNVDDKINITDSKVDTTLVTAEENAKLIQSSLNTLKRANKK